jgi:Lsr2
MAQRVLVNLVDDLDGGEAHTTTTFGLDGTTYEIDLSKEHDGELRAFLGKYADHARKLSRSQLTGGASGARGQRPGNPHGVDASDVRAWLGANGYEGQFKDRGRIPERLMEKYMARTSAPMPAREETDQAPALALVPDEAASAPAPKQTRQTRAKATTAEAPATTTPRQKRATSGGRQTGASKAQ